jgi:hypothetical protein
MTLAMMTLIAGSPQLEFVRKDAQGLNGAHDYLGDLFTRMKKTGLTYRSGKPLTTYHGPAFGQLVASIWREERRLNGDKAAALIAETYVDATGGHAWDK